MWTHWQDLAALALVAWAAIYLGRSGWRVWSRRRQGACGTCPSCSSEPSPLVTLGPAADPAGSPPPAR